MAQTARIKTGRFIPQLTGLRAVAAYMVYAHNIPIQAPFLPRDLRGVLSEMHIGVTLFFVLSGFVIFRNYFGTLQQTPRAWMSYLGNRIARLYPIYFLVTVVTLLLLPVDTFDWFVNLTFLRGFSDAFKYSGAAQGWSLTPEWTFYVLAPVLFILIRAYGFWLPLLLTYCTGAVLLVIGEWVDFRCFFTGFNFVFAYTFFGRCFEFYAGMYLARWLDQPANAAKLRRSGQWYTWTSIVLVLATIFVMWKFQSLLYRYGVDHPIGRLLNNFLLPVLFCGLFYGLIAEQSSFRRFLCSKTMLVLGASSYAFYMIHMGVFQDFFVQNLPFGSFLHNEVNQNILGVEVPIDAIVRYVLVFLLLNLFAVGLFYCFESPMNRLLRRHLVHTPPPQIEHELPDPKAAIMEASAMAIRKATGKLPLKAKQG
jgi:peptidoglycan/LPS O-acetylase OafA/YrhL